MRDLLCCESASLVLWRPKRSNVLHTSFFQHSSCCLKFFLAHFFSPQYIYVDWKMFLFMSCCCICLSHKSNNDLGLLNFILAFEIRYSGQYCLGLYTSTAFGRALGWFLLPRTFPPPLQWPEPQLSALSDLLSWNIPLKDTTWRQRCPDAAGAATITARKKVWRSTLNFIKHSAEAPDKKHRYEEEIIFGLFPSRL